MWRVPENGSMPQLRIAMAQTNPRVGDLEGNAAGIVERARSAARQGAHLVVFGELALTGYPVEDLALRSTFTEAATQRVHRLAGELADAGCGDLAVVLGCLVDHDGVRDAAAVLHGGSVAARQDKHHLASGGMFDEQRCFTAGSGLEIVRLHGVELGLAVGEDCRRPDGPVTALGAAGVDLVLGLDAAPYEPSNDRERWELLGERAREAGAPIAYCNLVGGQDELVFDGGSMLVTTDGGLAARSPQFAEHLQLADLELPGGAPRTEAEPTGYRVRRSVLHEQPLAAYPPSSEATVAEPLCKQAQVWYALVTALRDYVRKNGFHTVAFGFSGGIDSAVCAALVADAVGADALHGVSMPSVYSSEHARSDAAELAERLGCHFRTVPIAGMVADYVDTLGLTGLAEENVQARCRGVLLMALSNQEGHLVLAPGNKTELAVGYSTIYGDAVGGFAPLKDVPKTLVWQLARWRNAEAQRRGETPPIPPNSIEKPASAELRPDQRDTDSLPEYEVLDRLVAGYVEADRGYPELVAAGFDAKTVRRVLRMIDGAEYKRRQYPPGPKVSARAFDRERRLPITSAWREG